MADPREANPESRIIELSETKERGVHVIVQSVQFPAGYEPPSASLDPPPPAEASSTED
jgi:hypothetical protein